LTYALGRGPEYFDVEAIDRIVEQMERDQGRFSTLLLGVIESAPFQKRRTSAAAPAPPAKSVPKAKKISFRTELSLELRRGPSLALRACICQSLANRPDEKANEA
jgi:hypothetical protein